MSLHQRIAGFDGIRALAVICVVIQHLGLWQYAGASGFVADKLAPLFSGSTGVQAFFILSGFLITILLIKEIRTTGKVSIVAFTVRRSLRIFPLYLLFCLLATLALLLSNQVPWRSLAYAYLYVYNFVPAQHYVALLGHTWSLAVEEHFYLVWPVIFSLAYASNKHRRLMLGLAAFIVASLLLHFLLVRQAFSGEYFIARWSFLAGYNIALGCIGALLVTRDKPGAAGLLASPAAFALGIVLYANSLYLDTGSWFVQNVLCGYIRAPGILLLILWIHQNQGSALVRVLDIRPLRYIGTISYGIYMWQGFFLSTGPKRLEGEVWPPNPYTGLAMLVIVAPLSYRYFEQPFLNLKQRYMKKRPAPAASQRNTDEAEDDLAFRP